MIISVTVLILHAESLAIQGEHDSYIDREISTFCIISFYNHSDLEDLFIF